MAGAAAEPLIGLHHSHSNSNSMETDPMVRDNKELELSSLAQSIPLACFHLLVVLPVWAAVLLPCAAIYQAGLYCITCATGGKKKSAAADAASPTDYGSAAAPSPPRRYDVVLYGATGFTGKLAADYLARRYGVASGFTWALAGRRRAALEEVCLDKPSPLRPATQRRQTPPPTDPAPAGPRPAGRQPRRRGGGRGHPRRRRRRPRGPRGPRHEREGAP